MGLALTLCYLPVLEAQNWVRLERHRVAATIESINSDWSADARFFDETTPPAERNNAWVTFKNGALTRVAEVAGACKRPSIIRSLDFPILEHEGPVAFIEDKKIDMPRFEQLLERTRLQNHWTNFGPLSRTLETILLELLKLHDSKTVVMCASGTAALFGLAGLHAVKAGRRLRWVTSAYTFPCQRIGPFADAIVVDCDESGVINLGEVDLLGPQNWDGLIVTNLFGTQRQINRFQEYAASHGKRLLIDGATALFGVDRSGLGTADEMISFHHTKPWGFGEGGCAIVDKHDEMLLRSIFNFGLNSSEVPWPYAFNGKLSEISAASILERLERLPSWSFFYQRQRHRILTLANAVGLGPLGGINPDSITNSLPLLLPSVIPLDRLSGYRFAVHKYYRPLGLGHPHADQIYSRIVNVPCHPGMAAISTGELESFFSQLTLE